MKIRIVVTGRNYHTAGGMPDEVETPDGATVAAVLESLKASLSEGEQLSPNCLVAVSGEHIGTLANHTDKPLADGDELVLIAPVAGG